MADDPAVDLAKQVSASLKLSDLVPNLSANMRALTAVEVPRFDFPNIRTEAQQNYASEFYERLVKQINRFNASLDDAHEVGVRLVTFGQTTVFHLQGMGYSNPSLITFHGKTEEGNPVELIQHVSQISILLVKLPRQDRSQPKQMGFHAGGDSPAA